MADDLVQRLREQAAEVALQGVFGWGNTMTDAADALARKDAEIAEWHDLAMAVSVAGSDGKAVGGIGPDLWPCSWRQEVALVAYVLVSSMRRAVEAESQLAALRPLLGEARNYVEGLDIADKIDALVALEE